MCEQEPKIRSEQWKKAMKIFQGGRGLTHDETVFSDLRYKRYGYKAVQHPDIAQEVTN